ncbi:hypothetical protein ABB37_03410 [Leptomonas pyrrhocoris]|uniref:Uncharacterized protein n=1 Tax=Leptomonas pyrrhocoris TaxID=157538 RepID=A0A0N0VG17_LEPPY|nr:hypothetical protein ABB37_03410 [Leptomonas pyrrhocoris]KPA82314.1 hypothetical protein ABB37_03410 [Leptomonas pyrrhocoris]|eukprot:XP_015660753.1 hypothetical protein ABB37_03410 [Leptomonas pyrrhocoris]
MSTPPTFGSKKSKKQKARRRDQANGGAANAEGVTPASASSSFNQTTQDLAEAPPLSTSLPDIAFPDVAEQERAVEAVKATLPSLSNREELRKDPIYRIMHALPRSDVLEVVRSRFAAAHCVRAAAYFDLSYTTNPLRHLRLQIGCDGPTGLHLFFSRIAAHRHTLRMLDLSRNRLCAEDVVRLCNLLGLGADGRVAVSLVPDAVEVTKGDGAARNTTIFPSDSPSSCASSSSSSPSNSNLEVLDLSYNTQLGNDGALHVLRALRRCTSVRAVMLRSVGVDDAGALAVSDVVRQWPPLAPVASAESGLRPSTASATKFYLNLNENYIGARGTYVLGKGLPDYVSLTLAKQRPPLVKERKRARENAGASE